MSKQRIQEVIVVEGRYDKNILSQVVDATIVETGGFSVFNDREKLAFLRTLAQKRGIILLTDSDGAGFVIRNYLIRSLAVPDFLSVHPEVHRTVDSVEMDKDFTSFPVVRNIEVTAVGADRVRFVHNRVSFLALYERRVVAMRIRDVCINRSTVSVHFPIGRNRNFFPAGNIFQI